MTSAGSGMSHARNVSPVTARHDFVENDNYLGRSVDIYLGRW